MAAALVVLTLAGSRAAIVMSAVVFGLGYGTAYPVFAGYVTHAVGDDRRGAAFGAILAAFDTGIGTGSTLTGWIAGHGGLALAFGVAAALATLSLPAFVVADHTVGRRSRRRRRRPRRRHEALPRWPLAVLAVLLAAVEPLAWALRASAIVDRVADRGWPAVSLLAARLVVTSIGVAAGLALWRDRPWACDSRGSRSRSPPASPC